MKLFKLFRKEPPPCEFIESCNCKELNKTKRCDRCYWFWVLDSGYGYCRALPIPVLVAWCKDPCSLYTEESPND